jgi:molybdate transport system substrate-binding protein
VITAVVRIAVCALLIVISGCASTPRTDRLLVFAAASLKTPFAEIGDRFTAANPGTAVELSFAGSADLLSQLTQGADADVFASADTPTMDRTAEAGLLGGQPAAFATNTLTITVAPENPLGVKSFRDLENVSVVVCAVQVPCGAALPRLEQEAGVDLRPVSEEISVTDVLNKVTSGAADAGLVYVTDALAAGDSVTAVSFPEAANAINTYQIATLKQSRDTSLASDFVNFVAGPVGRSALAAAGFGNP